MQFEKLKATFGELEDGDFFLLGWKSKQYRKISLRQRSSQRPFAVNAKVDEYCRTVKSGFITDDTLVYQTSSGTSCWIGSEDQAPAGWLAASSVDYFFSLLDGLTPIRTVSVLGNLGSLHEGNSHLNIAVTGLMCRLRSYYKLGKYSDSISLERLPKLTVHDDKGQLVEDSTSAANLLLEGVRKECRATLVNHDED